MGRYGSMPRRRGERQGMRFLSKELGIWPEATEKWVAWNPFLSKRKLPGFLSASLGIWTEATG